MSVEKGIGIDMPNSRETQTPKIADILSLLAYFSLQLTRTLYNFEKKSYISRSLNSRRKLTVKPRDVATSHQSLKKNNTP